MIDGSDKNFVYLNRQGQWLGSQWDGLELYADGALRLRSLPLATTDSGALAARPVPDGPGGIAIAPDGTVFYTDFEDGRLLAIDSCNGKVRLCRSGLQGPRGLVYSPLRRALMVVESDGNEILLLHAETGQTVEVRGATSGLVTPWTLAEDKVGAVYVVDYGAQRVVKFGVFGDLDPSFWITLEAAHILTGPVDIAAGTDTIYIVDGPSKSIFVVAATGKPLLDDKGHPVHFGDGLLVAPMGIVADASKVYVGDNARRQILQFDVASGYSFDGVAVGYEGPVAALALDGKGNLLVHTGASLTPTSLLLAGGYATQGLFWSGPIATPLAKPYWYRLQSICDELPSGAHLRFFISTSDDPLAVPSPMQGAAMPFAGTEWAAKPEDVLDITLGDAAARYLCIGALFSGDGHATPTIRQLQVQYDQRSYIADLPAIYRKPDGCKDFLKRLLSLYQSFNHDLEGSIDSMPTLFDPKAAPAGYLSWLAGWLALTPEEDWDVATTRSNIAAAFARYAQTGTSAGLRTALKECAGVDAVIEEPITTANLWALPAPGVSGCASQTSSTGSLNWTDTENSILGYTTMLASAEAQGAVVGSTAVLDQSHLITDAEFGAPLFEDVAFRFVVLLYRGQLNDAATLPLVRSVIDEQKPAHTSYEVCVVEPGMRVGYQARLGIDTVVGGASRSLRLGESFKLGIDTGLGGPPPLRIDGQSRLGVNMLGS